MPTTEDYDHEAHVARINRALEALHLPKSVQSVHIEDGIVTVVEFLPRTVDGQPMATKLQRPLTITYQLDGKVRKERTD